MHRKGHIGVTLLLYSPVVLIVGHAVEWLLPLLVLGAVLLADALLPVTALLRAIRSRGRFRRVSFSPAMLPDLDMRLPGVKHRGVTHTVWFAVLCAVLAAAFGLALLSVLGAVLLPARPFALLAGVLFFAYLGFHAVVTHLVGDVITPAGIRPFAPVRSTEYSLGLVKAANPAANALCYVAGLCAVGASIAAVL